MSVESVLARVATLEQAIANPANLLATNAAGTGGTAAPTAPDPTQTSGSTTFAQALQSATQTTPIASTSNAPATTQGQQIVRTAESQLGQTEQPPGSGSANGQVVLLPSGAVATTQYSASTGGYTAPGTFQAVPDTGDAVCEDGVCNPYHQYEVSIPVSAITSQFPQLGTLDSIDITQRNGDGDFGGRVLQMSLVGSARTVN
ncbi:MAG: hypothetical protein ABSH36_18650, partial [Solirubrobacteraceae bacterium]